MFMVQIMIQEMAVVFATMYMFAILHMHIRLHYNTSLPIRIRAICDIFNLGTGNGVTVLEAIKAFEKVSGVKLNYTIAPRRPGDVVAIYANNNFAVTSLNWHIKYDLDDMMRTAWQWELKVKEDEELISKQNPVLN
jgi:UDP-glucose 4-epimerase